MAQRPPSDASRTSARVRPGEHGQFVGSSSFLGHTLPEGTRIGGFEITGLVGEGGFGIVYLAYDDVLQRELAIKEYMPSSLAARAIGSHTVTVKSERHRETFQAGLKSFVNEARLLAKFDHPSLLKVYRFWEANGTAYMAMPFYEGRTLKQELAAMREPPSEERLRGWLAPLLDALTVMHEAHCFHRDIAPDNILLTPDGPMLLDFGAARRVIGDMTHALTVVLKPGYAPVEQYGDSPTMTQGAWTDLYALACVVYYAITGKTPLSSVERMMSGDAMPPLSRVAAGRYSEGFLRAIDAGLAILPRDRPQSVAQFRALLEAGRVPPAAPRAPAPKAVPLPQAAPRVGRAEGAAPVRAVQTVETAAAVAHAPASIERSTIIRSDAWSATAPDVTVAMPAARASARRHGPLLWIVAAGGLVLATAGAILLADFGSQPAPLPTAGGPIEAPPPVQAQPPVEARAPVEAPPAPTPSPATSPTPSPALASGTAPPDTAATDAGAPDTGAAPADIAAVGLAEPPAKAEAAAAPAKRPARSPAATPSPPMTKAMPARCSDILQKASLEPLTPEEDAFLRRDCR